MLGRNSHGGAGWGHGADTRLMYNTGPEQPGWPDWAAPPSAQVRVRGHETPMTRRLGESSSPVGSVAVVASASHKMAAPRLSFCGSMW